jgi:hypothetical protein
MTRLYLTTMYKTISGIFRTPITPGAFALMSFLHLCHGVVMVVCIFVVYVYVLNKNLMWEQYKNYFDTNNYENVQKSESQVL